MNFCILFCERVPSKSADNHWFSNTFIIWNWPLWGLVWNSSIVQCYKQSFYWDYVDHFSLYNKYENKFFTKVLRTISRRHYTEPTQLSCNWRIKIMFHIICHCLCYFTWGRSLLLFPLYYTCLSTEWGMISLCHCISLRLTANQTTHCLKSLAPFCGYIWPVTLMLQTTIHFTIWRHFVQTCPWDSKYKLLSNRVATGQGKVREIQGQGKVGILEFVREIWNFVESQGNSKKVREI